jgi:hypothetical protein
MTLEHRTEEAQGLVLQTEYLWDCIVDAFQEHLKAAFWAARSDLSAAN